MAVPEVILTNVDELQVKAKKLNILLRILVLMTYISLQGIFTTMIGFVTWPPYI